MKNLTLLNDDTNVKLGDTGTLMQFKASDDNAPVSLIKGQSAVFRIKNDLGFLKSINAETTMGGYVFQFDTSELSDLVTGTYQLELAITKSADDIEIYPDNGFVQFTITENALSIVGEQLPVMSLDSFKKEVSEYVSNQVNGAETAIKNDFQKYVGSISDNTIDKANKASQDAKSAIDKADNAVTTANSASAKSTANSVLIQGTNTSLSKITENFGGRNFLLNSAKHDDSNWLVRYDDNHANIGRYMDSNIYRTSTSWSGLKYDVSDLINRGLLVSGESYTFSVYLKADTGINLNDTVYFYANNIFETTRPVDFSKVNNSEFVQISTTLKVINNTIPTQKQIGFETKKSIDNGYIYFACPKLEKGTVATDYTPAPEDIANTQATLQQQLAILTTELAKLKAGGA